MNVLLRIAQRNHPMHCDARECVRVLFRRKDVTQIVPQVLFEFWVVATRPVESNGLGLPSRHIGRIELGIDARSRSFTAFASRMNGFTNRWRTAACVV